ncbi:MAG: hypothetical protein JXA25_12975 [Anaerolineales bacterium]|nr:hypothetical protein [Anaerolineales bacterium]
MNKTVARSFRTSLIILIIFLAVIFNFERLQYIAGLEVVGIHNFLYLLILIFIIKNILFPIRSNQGLWWHSAFGAMMYLVLRLTIFYDGGLFGGIKTYGTISEILFLVLAILLTARTMQHFYRMEDILDEMFFPGLDERVVAGSLAQREIDRELSRCRRYQHPLSLVMIKPDQGKGGIKIQALLKEVQQYGISRIVGASVGKLLAENIRRSDTIIRNDKDGLSYLVLCPETTSEGASTLAEGIFELAKRKGITISYSTASFPDDAITYDDLISQAEKRIGSRESFVPGTMLPEANR